ncbi:hypothetical protein OBBRIDRAFT_100132 [Obba rivulosa]|uniref:Tail specific protease domain-containing protein n=1 Tax=Obba rivulosa TaxID=1052685 RepID=A0A8E2J6T5_9APHY|nr:hypothetical protein OBBRIDRAFT_100132 [Obba rivulosa]
MPASLVWTGLLFMVVGLPILSSAIPAPRSADPCAKIAGQAFVVPADAMACLTSFPFNETLRQNVMSVVSNIFDFYTFEDYYLNSPPPFQESTVQIRQELARINTTQYSSDYEFNRDLYNVTTILNDGHTRWLPSCYQTFQNLLPAPVVTLEVNGEQNVFIAPDSVEFINLVGTEYTDYFASIGFDWQRLAGARVLSIAGMDPYAYADLIADTETGNYLDHGVRVNSCWSSYRISGTDFSQRFGDIAGPGFPDRNTLTMEVLLANSTKKETVTIPFLASYLGENFTDSASFWTANCAANNETNGVDFLSGSDLGRAGSSLPKRPRAVIKDASQRNAVGLPDPFLPTAPPVNGSEAVIKSFILPDKKTGVMFVGSFEPDDFNGFQFDVEAAIKQFKAEGVSQVLIDLSNNGGGFVCLGQFLHEYLAGSKIGNPGFQSTNRANPLAQKIVENVIAKGITSNFSFYAPDNWASLDNVMLPNTFNYDQPPVTSVINGATYIESQRFFDVCTPFAVDMPEEPPFDLSKVAIVGNADCASTCAMFSTLMFERHQTKVAIFGGKPGLAMEYKGMAGNQVLEWTDIDSEIKTSGLANDPLAPPDLLVNADFRHNWRTAYSFLNEKVPIAYESEHPQFRFPFTVETYMNPQNLWEFAAKQLF